MFGLRALTSTPTPTLSSGIKEQRVGVDANRQRRETLALPVPPLTESRRSRGYDEMPTFHLYIVDTPAPAFVGG